MIPSLPFEGWSGALLGLSARVALLLLIALGVTTAMRRASAAARHLVWSVAMLSVLLLPVLERVVPALPVLPRLETAAPEVDRPVAAAVPAPAGVTEPAVASTPSPSPAEAPAAGSRWADLDPLRLVLLLWLLGAGLVLVRLLAGVAGVWWLGRRATMVTDGGWLHLAHDLARQLGLSRGVTLLRGDRGSVPMTWGVLQPVVWLPAEAESWTPERRRVVLAHELAHVRRRDALTQWIAHLALVVHWFNPAVWIAARKLREERERACDDAVLSIGTRAPDYADHLLDIVRSFGERSGPVAAMAMARRSQFEGRLLAILDRAAPRKGVDRRAALGAALFVLLAVLPAAALRAAETSGPLGPVSLAAPSPESWIPPADAERAADAPERSSGASPLRDEPASDTIPGAAGGPDLLASLVPVIREIDSDGEKAALLTRTVQLPELSAAALLDVVRASRTISSSGDRSGVLLAVLQRPGLTPRARAELIEAVAEIPSSGDQAMVLTRLLAAPDLSAAELASVFRVVEEIESDGDAAAVLTAAARRHRALIRDDAHRAYLAAVRAIQSDGDRAAALGALLDPTPAASGSGGSARGSTWSTHTSLLYEHESRPAAELEITAEKVVLNAAKDGIAALEPGGFLRVTHALLPGYTDADPLRPRGSEETLTRQLEVSRSGGGELRFDYRVNGQPREFGGEGRAWLARLLREIHRP